MPVRLQVRAHTAVKIWFNNASLLSARLLFSTHHAQCEASEPTATHYSLRLVSHIAAPRLCFAGPSVLPSSCISLSLCFQTVPVRRETSDAVGALTGGAAF